MKVRELKAFLAAHDDDDEVVLARDAEGNGYSPLAAAWEGVYVPADGDVYVRGLTEEDYALGYTAEDLYDGEGGVLAVVLSPC